MRAKARRESANVDHLDLQTERAEARRKRRDYFWEGTVQINARTFPVLFHVWRDDSFSKRPGWWYCLDINPDKRRMAVADDTLMYDSREKCGGERDEDLRYRGGVAMALYKAFVDFGKSRGFRPVVDYRDGWFTFEMLCDPLSPPEVEFNYRLQCVEYRKRIDCAIHGPHTKLTREWGR